MPIREPVRVEAPAKLNLALAVGPADPAHDGRHPVCSWMTPIDLHDELTLTALEEGHFSRYAIIWAEDAKRRTDIDWSITRDLAVRAHHALESALSRRLAVQLKLEKRIPVGAGLGGGSSDAAAMLVGLNQLFELGLDDAQLAEIGATVGSDVPFFIRSVASIVEGFGERMRETPATPRLHTVVVAPSFPCDTGAVYRAFDRLSPAGAASSERPFPERVARVRELAETGRFDSECLFNDLRAAAVTEQPDLDDLIREVASIAEAPVHLTGSGSALFILCEDPMHAEYLARAIEERLEDASVYDLVSVPSRSNTD